MNKLSTNDRLDIIGCKISTANPQSAADAINERLESAKGGYICFSNVHTVVTSKNNRSLRASTNNSFLSLPDGKPLSVYARMKGYEDVRQVAGPDFMPFCMSEFPDAKHFFYGSTQKTLDMLRKNLLSKFPNITIVGMYSPPFRALHESEITNIHNMINAKKPNFIWVGLGAPKQEEWMMKNCKVLKPAILFGVGAAFDFHAGTIKRSPLWMRKYGLEWLHRLSQEPNRLFRRYLVTNILFIYYLIQNYLAVAIGKSDSRTNNQ